MIISHVDLMDEVMSEFDAAFDLEVPAGQPHEVPKAIKVQVPDPVEPGKFPPPSRPAAPAPAVPGVIKQCGEKRVKNAVVISANFKETGEAINQGAETITEEAIMGRPELPGTILRLPFVYGPGDQQHRFYSHVRRMADGRPGIILGRGLAGWRGTAGFVANVAAAIAPAVAINLMIRICRPFCRC